MPRTNAASPSAARARVVVEELQRSFVAELEALAEIAGAPSRFQRVEWLRDGGAHGGGDRFSAPPGCATFQRASINVSQVHYDDEPGRRLSSATALSAIVHPAHPRAPSIHVHVSFTELREGLGSWRFMADLNPSLPDADATTRFAHGLRAAAPDLYEEARQQGDRYFYIPALSRHRGATHFYVEGYASHDLDADAALGLRIGRAAIQRYGEVVGDALARHGPPTEDERAAQLAYHTLYLLQVLTLDRGTTSGLLVHDQNDLGILGSLPARVDRALLASWVGHQVAPQDALLRGLVDALPSAVPSPVEDPQKLAFTHLLRDHYRAHPEALDLQARGDRLPDTVVNHR